jgi:predicted GNAT family acetyltransferase
VFVNVVPEHRQRGWGRAVTNAVVGALLKQQVTPLYSAAEDNDASQALAESVGFADTGAREVLAQAIYEK